MSEINFNSIYDGVSLALHAAFPNSNVHGGEVKQGLKPGGQGGCDRLRQRSAHFQVRHHIHH